MYIQIYNIHGRIYLGEFREMVRFLHRSFESHFMKARGRRMYKPAIPKSMRDNKWGTKEM